MRAGAGGCEKLSPASLDVAVVMALYQHFW